MVAKTRLWRSILMLMLLILFTISSCRSSEDGKTTPTPFPVAVITVRPIYGQPFALALEDLAENPAFFQGVNLRLTGMYQKLPRLVCNRDPHPSPATWSILGSDVIANASGLDAQLRALLTDGQPITAEGVWLRWTGPIGCGKQAKVKDVWYLSVNRILEPHPLTKATRPAQIIAQEPPPPEPTTGVDETMTAESGTVITTTVTAETGTPPPVETTSATASLPPATNTITPTETAVIITATPLTTITITGTTTITNTHTPTPANTAPPGSTPTQTGTPLSTATSGPNTIVDKGELDFRDLIIDSLSTNTTDIWQFEVTDADIATVNVIPASNEVDLLLTLRAPNGQILVNAQNNGGPGESEVINKLNIPVPGSYEIEVTANTAIETDYALLAVTNEDPDTFINMIFQEHLPPNSLQVVALLEETIHFWFFTGNQGDVISLEVNPISTGVDPYLELFGPDGAKIMEIDDGDTDDPEALENYTLLTEGLYSLRVDEFDFSPMQYDIKLTR